MIRDMQALGVMSLLLCVACMLLLFAGEVFWGKVFFGLSLVLMMASLGVSVREIQVSVNALDVQLHDLETQGRPKF